MKIISQLLILLFVPLSISIIATSCKHEPVYPKTPVNDTTSTINNCDPDSVYFTNEVLPIFVSNCAKSGCHDASTAQNGVVLDSYNNIVNTGDVRPGDPSDSEVYEMITETDPDDRMPPPPNTPLTSDQIALIRKWIMQGAKNLTCTSDACDTSNVTFSASIKPLLQNKCVGCHSGSTPSGGHDFTTHAGVQPVAQSGRLYGAVNHMSGFVPMPQGGTKLANCDIRKIKIWIDAGAQNN
jgi:hypothetical protein